MGWSLEKALTYKPPYVTDHLGNKFKTKQEMIEYYGKTRDTVYGRLKAGWSLERALTE